MFTFVFIAIDFLLNCAMNNLTIAIGQDEPAVMKIMKMAANGQRLEPNKQKT